VRDRRLPWRDERGATSLAEVSVSLFVLGLVMTMFMTVTGAIQTTTARSEGRVQRNDEARLALAQLDREIRSGNVLYDPSLESNVGGDVVAGMSLRVYTQADAPNRNPGNQCSQWRITGDTMQTRRWASTDPAGTVTPWWTVAHDIVNRTVVPTVQAFTLDSTAAYGGRIMKVAIVVDHENDAAAPEKFELSITGRNTQYGYPTNVCQTIPDY
jgi:type II secretory pathway component PulJ